MAWSKRRPRGDSRRRGTSPRARDTAWAQELAESADDMVGTRPDTAILLGLQSLSRSPEQEPVPPEGLVTGLARFTHPFTVLDGHGQAAVNGVAAGAGVSLMDTHGTRKV